MTEPTRGTTTGSRLTTDDLAGTRPDEPATATVGDGAGRGTEQDQESTRGSGLDSGTGRSGSGLGSGTGALEDAPPGELLAGENRERMIDRWQEIQTAFVDQPQEAVQEADALVAELMQQLAQAFAAERQRLEGQWSRGDQVSTEDLRLSLQRYRSFFRRLLSI